MYILLLMQTDGQQNSIKLAGGSWKSKTKKESVTIEDANGNTFAEVVDVVSVEDMQRKEEIKASIAEEENSKQSRKKSK